MARYSILSKPVLFTLPVITALFASAIPAPAQSGPETIRPPLIVPYRPLMPEMDGWHQEGILVDHSLAAAGPDAWLAAHSYRPTVGSQNGTMASTVLRMMRRNGPPARPILLPDVLDQGFNGVGIIQTIPGEQGAWALWRTAQGVKAWWISAATGQPQGQPMILPGYSGISEFHVAGDGQTGWVISNSWMGSGVVTLTATGGPPRITGSTLLPGSFLFYNQTPKAAHRGRLLVVQNLTGTPRLTVCRTVDATAVVSAPITWPDRSLGEYGISYGLMGHGDGWQMIYSTQVTPLLAGQIVMGLELLPGGLPAAAPARSLFVATDPFGPSLAVISSPDKGAILMTTISNFTGRAGFAMILEKGAPDQVAGAPSSIQYSEATNGFPNGRPAHLPLSGSLNGNFLAVLESQEESDGAFAQTLHVFDLLASPFEARSTRLPVNAATGIQEEPALAWLPDAAVVSWQQISTVQAGPAIHQRLYRTGNTSPDLVLAATGSLRLSSPDVAVNQNRMLMVARQPSENSNYADPDDVAGILIENGQAITAPFKIGYGPGSQRAACAAPYQDGFCVVWREELNLGSPDYESRIRLAILDRNGFPAHHDSFLERRAFIARVGRE